MTNAKQMMEHLAGFASKTFLEEGEVLPMWVLEDGKGRKMPIMTPFSNEEEKDLVATFIRGKAKEIGAVVVGFMSEAWVVEKLSSPDDLKCQPSQHEDRREVINIYAEDAGGKSVMGMYYILRPEHGKPTLSPLKVMDGTVSNSGRFVSLLEG